MREANVGGLILVYQKMRNINRKLITLNRIDSNTGRSVSTTVIHHWMILKGSDGFKVQSGHSASTRIYMLDDSWDVGHEPFQLTEDEALEMVAELI